MTNVPRYWLIIPAAGIGARLGSEKPKQYLSLMGKTVMENSLDSFLDDDRIEKIFVSVNSEDQLWNTLPVSEHPKIMTVEGGEDRHLSVFNGLKVLKEIAESDDWVIVHDAARPCITASDINQLIEETKGHSVGGVLGAPVSDTLKQIEYPDASSEENTDKPSPTIVKTVDRSITWAAYTPQIFRFNLLYDALRTLVKAGTSVTDESSAIEYAGYQPLMIKGRRDNIKITVPGDLEIAEKIKVNQSE